MAAEKKRDGKARAAAGLLVYTRDETKQHEEAIAQLLPSQTLAAIARHMHREFGISSKRVARLAARVRERWVREDEASGALAVNRAEAIRRVKRMLAIASGKRSADGAWTEKPNHAAVAKYESLLAQLQGTNAPIKLDLEVRVSASIQGVIANLTAEQVREISERQRELRELAERERLRSLPAAGGSR